MSSPTVAPPPNGEEVCELPTKSELNAGKIKQTLIELLRGIKPDGLHYFSDTPINLEDTKNIFELLKGIETPNKELTELMLNGITEENALKYHTLITSSFSSSSCDSIVDYPILKLMVDTIEQKYKDKLTIKMGGSMLDSAEQAAVYTGVGLAVTVAGVVGLAAAIASLPFTLPLLLASSGTNTHFGGKGKKQQTKRQKHSRKNSKSRRINKKK